MVVVLGILAVIIFAVILLSRRKQRGNSQGLQTQRPASAPATARFHAVSLSVSSNACNAARSLEGERFLSGDAPQIPLPDCDAVECGCRFVHLNDRRDGEDRRDGYAGSLANDFREKQGENRHREERRDK